MLKKVALISDIQGNYTALRLVLKQIDTENVEKIICLGDVASGAHPHEVLELLRHRQIPVVKGNMDDEILYPRRHESDNLDSQRYDDIDQWCSEQLTDEDRAQMSSFVHLLRFELEEAKQLLCLHGSPYSYNDAIDETLSEKQLQSYLEGYTEEVMATGHMHHPFIRYFQNTMIFNPGSVGLPRKQDGKHPLLSHYAIVEIVDEKVNIAFRQVEVDSTELKRDILNSDMPHANWFLSQWDMT